MADGTIFPAFIQLRYEPDDSAKTGFLREVDSTLESAERRFSQFSTEAQRMVDRAMDARRTSSGSLDLNVAGLQREAAILRDRALAAREVAQATELAAKEAGDYSQAARLQVAATQALAREAEHAAASARDLANAQAQVQQVLNRHTSAVQTVGAATTRGAAANDNMRFGLMDLGRQLSDVSTMYALGAKPMQIYASQIGQIVQSVQMMSGSTSRLAGFLGGPWGIALTTATLALSPLIGKLFESANAADSAADAANRLTAALTNLGKLKFDSDDLTTVQRKMLELEGEAAALERRAVQAGADRGAGGLYYRQQAEQKLKEAQSLQLQLQDAVDPKNPVRIITERNQALLDAKPDRPDRSRANDLARLVEFGEDAGKKIGNIRDRFIDIPPEVQKVNVATRELDDIISDLERRKPEGFAEMVEQAKELKSVLPDLGLDKAMADLREQSAQQLQVERLILAGREEEAEALQIIWRLKEQFGPAAEAEADAVRSVVQARHDELKAIQRLRDEQSYYLDATKSVRSEIEAIFAGRGSFGNFKQIFKDLNAKVLTDQLFGDTLEELDDSVKAQFGRAIDQLEVEMDRTERAFLSMTNAVDQAAARLSSPGAGSTGFDEAFSPDFWATLNPNGPMPSGPPITVTADISQNSVMGMTPDSYVDRLSQRLASVLGDELNEVFDTRFFSKMQGTFAGAFYGYSTAGSVGGALGGFRGLIEDFGGELFGGGDFGNELAGDLYDNLSDALRGAQMGSTVNGIAGSLGIKLNKTAQTGSQIGGAIGAMLPIPGGEILGSISGAIWGTILSKVFGSTKYGTASLTGANAISVSSKGKGRSEGANTLGGSVQEALSNIAEQLSGDVGSFRVSIGTFKDKFVVSPTGAGGKLVPGKNGVKEFADQGEALAYAVMDAIKDGAITGLSRGAQNLLRGNSDIEKAVQDAVDFESVFKRLKAAKDPVGAEMDDLDQEFGRLKDLFTKAGASTQEWAQLEELYWLERDEIVKQGMANSLSSLKSFMEELTTGNSALSLRDRRASALASYDPLKSRVASGDTTAYDEFVEASRALLDIERDMFGSQSSYFDRLNEVTSLTQQALDGGTGTPFADRDSPFGSRNDAAVVSGITTTNQLLELMAGQTNAQLAAVNQNLGSVAALLRSSGPVANYGRVEAGW